ncbi:MAG: GTP-binding protein [Clostridiaceae bacterium]|nr:GTP-binding protein [Clostridiaceae bacterium]
MIPLYLITGFLGAGKTTFLKKFIKLFADKKLALIINEFGKEGIDGAFFKDTGTALSEISNGSIFCSCKLDQFEQVLKKFVEKEPDLIIIEASGLSNPQNVHKILAQPDFKAVDFKGSICLLDALNFHKVFYSALACKQQLSVADMVIINKTDLVTPENLNQTRRIIEKFRPGVPVFTTSFGRIEEEWLYHLKPGQGKDKPLRQVADITLQKFLLDVAPIKNMEILREFISIIAQDTYRIKGFVSKDGSDWFVDCVGSEIKILLYDGNTDRTNKLVVLTGSGLPALKSIKNAINKLNLSENIIIK